MVIKKLIFPEKIKAGPPVIVSLETSTRICSLALLRGERALFSLSFIPSSGHSACLLPAVDSMSRLSGYPPSTWQAVIVSSGPGSFTGLRIGMATAKALSLGLNVPLYSVPTLDALAHRLDVDEGEFICTIIDARKGQLFISLYRKSGHELKRDIQPSAVYPEDIPGLIPREALFTGDGIDVYGQRIKEAYGEQIRFAPRDHRLPNAVFVGRLGLRKFMNCQPSELTGLVPEYARVSDAELNYDINQTKSN